MSGDDQSGSVVKALAAAAATGAATFAARKAFATRTGDEDDVEDMDERDEEKNDEKGSLRQLLSPAQLASLSEFLVPFAGQAADKVGRYVAEHAPDAVRKEVVDRFVAAYKKAS